MIAPRTAIYCRVSSDVQEKGGHGLEYQLSNCESACNERGHDIQFRIDDIWTGGDLARPGLDKLRGIIKQGLVDVVMVYDMTRLSRNTAHSILLREEFNSYNVRLETPSGVIEHTPEGKAMADMQAVFAEYERAKIRERTRQGKLIVAKKGKWNGGNLPFGYNYINGELVINEAEADVVRNMFQSVDNGMKLQAWATLANKQGIPTKTGGKWSGGNLSRTLKNTAYIGEGFYDKSREPIPVSFPQIIEPDLFNRVRARLAENQKMSPCTSKNNYLLSKLGRCHCGGRLGCRVSKGHRYVFCFNQVKRPDIYQCHKPTYWKMGVLEEFIWGTVEDLLGEFRRGVTNTLIDNFLKAQEDSNGTIEKCEKELKTLGQEKQRVITQVQRGTFTDDEVKLTMANIREREEHFQSELNTAKELQTRSEIVWEELSAQLENARRMFDWGFTISNNQKRQILITMLEEFVLFADGQIEMRYKRALTPEQIQDTVASMLSVDTSSGEGDTGGDVENKSSVFLI